MSPRPGPRKPILSIRVTEEGKAEIARLAQDEGITPSKMARRLIDEAITARKRVR